MTNSTHQKSLARLSARLQALQPTIDVLWSKLVPENDASGPRSIGFMGAQSGAGATLMAACGAIGIARHLRAKVLLIETNYHSAQLAHYADLAAKPGLTELLRGQVDLESALQATDVAGLSILPAGSTKDVSPGFFSTNNAEELFESFVRDFDFVIYDIPPVLEYTETFSLFRRLDDVCLVLQSGETTAKTAERAAKELSDCGANFLGCVLNRYVAELPAWFGGNRAA